MSQAVLCNLKSQKYLDSNVAFVISHLLSISPSARRPLMMVSSTQWNWWPLTRWWTCRLMAVCPPPWAAWEQWGPSMETLRYTWGVGAQRRYLAPLQALAINTTVNHPYPKHPSYHFPRLCLLWSTLNWFCVIRCT